MGPVSPPKGDAKPCPSAKDFTLLKVIAGVCQPNEGSVHWAGRDLDEHDLAPHEIGYVPQFGIAFDLSRRRERRDGFASARRRLERRRTRRSQPAFFGRRRAERNCGASGGHSFRADKSGASRSRWRWCTSPPFSCAMK